MKNITRMLIAGFFLSLAGASPLKAEPVLKAGGYDWTDKLGRGVLNMVSSPVEVARTISIQSRVKGGGYGWTVGLVEGLGRGFVRLGAGAIDTLTFPFDFPTEDKSPLLSPTYPWQKWDVEYL